MNIDEVPVLSEPKLEGVYVLRGTQDVMSNTTIYHPSCFSAVITTSCFGDKLILFLIFKAEHGRLMKKELEYINQVNKDGIKLKILFNKNGFMN